MPPSPSIRRRRFVRLLGGGVIVAAGAATLGWVSRDAMPEAAISPWRDPGLLETDPRRKALSFALLAPNPHNLQAWLVALKGEDEVVLYCDRERLLPHTDPFSRQIMIGHGAFIELFVLAASAGGYATEVTLFPEGEFGPKVDARPVASLRIRKGADSGPDPLFSQVLNRRSYKKPFDLGRSVSNDVISAVATSGQAPGVNSGFTVDPERLPRLRNLAVDALRLECATPRTLKESIDVLRIGATEIAAHRDGVSLHGPMFWWLSRLGLLTRESSLDPTHAAHRSTVATLTQNAETAMGFLWLTTTGNRRVDQVAAGRAYVRMNLAATSRGLQMHPLSQALQEYAEMAPLRRQLHELIDLPSGHTLQMFPRVGYAEPRGPSPRRGLAAHLLPS